MIDLQVRWFRRQFKLPEPKEIPRRRAARRSLPDLLPRR